MLFLALVALLSARPSPAADGPSPPAPWESAAFSVDPKEIRSAADRLAPPEGAASEVLFEEARYSFDSAGRRRFQLRTVIRVVTAADAAGWSSFQRAWSPWFEERPVLRARVITKEGAVHVLDPATIAEEPLGGSSSQVFSDRRQVRAPLPAVAAGSIVEREFVSQEKEPLFKTGAIHHFYFGYGVPSRRTRLIIEFPARAPLKYVTRKLEGIEPKREEENGVVRLRFEAQALAPTDPVEGGLPGDVPRYRMVAFTPGVSWSEVSSAYAAIVDAQIRDEKAVAPLVKLAKEQAKGREALIGKLTALLHQEVRYTGIEFAEASIVPRQPEEVLKRKFGDCKDKAALLVAMLRAAGIPARVALLNAGTGTDSEPDLPGLGDFNHAIVYIPGDRPVWIDPTADLMRPGELPSGDQDRLALVAGGTGTLVRTPAALSRDNRIVQTREFVLAERGPAQVIDTFDTSGPLEWSLRQGFQNGDKKKLREGLEKYVQFAFLAKELNGLENGDPQDLSKPFRVRLESREAKRGSTDDEQAVAAILTSELADRMPALLTAEEPEKQGKQDKKAADAKHRKGDFVFAEPYIAEWHYKITPPLGFTAASLPERVTTPIGTASYSAEFSSGKDGTVTGTLRFDSGKRRISALEFEALRSALAEFQRSRVLMVRFELTGAAHLAAGRFREALGEFRKLADQHPKEALHRVQLADALLQAGLGTAARKEAQQATALEPESALAFRTLGWVLEHDQFGRRFREGFDREGALAALRKAKTLDPTDSTARADLAILLEYDRSGVRYGPASDLAAAVAEYQALRKDLSAKNMDDNLGIALLWSRRFRELRDYLRDLEPSPARNRLTLVSVAAMEGGDAALREGGRLIGDAGSRREAFEGASRSLTSLRLYAPAAVLLAEAAKGSSEASKWQGQAELLRKIRRLEDVPLPPNEPLTAVKRFIVALLVTREDKQSEVLSLMTRDSAKYAFGDEKGERLADWLRSLRHEAAAADLTGEIVADIALGSIQFAVEGNDAVGYRVRAQGATDSGMSEIWFVVKEEGRYKVLAWSAGLSGVGREALRRADAGDLAGARRWLDWVREDLQPIGGDDPFAGSPFPRLWTRGANAGLQRIRIAAASLMVFGKEADRALPILAEFHGEPGDPSACSVDHAIALGSIYLKRYPGLLAATESMMRCQPDSAAAFSFHQLALVHLKRFADIHSASAERMKRLPDDIYAIRNMAEAASMEGDFATTARLYRELIDKGRAEAGDFNNAAWNAMVMGPVDTRALDDARRAVLLTKEKEHAVLHTLAALYAEAGQTTQARETLFKALDAGNIDEPGPEDWYVLGRIAEQYGEKSAAADAYRRVTASPDISSPGSSYALAQKRLAGLSFEKVPR